MEKGEKGGGRKDDQGKGRKKSRTVSVFHALRRVIGRKKGKGKKLVPRLRKRGKAEGHFYSRARSGKHRGLQRKGEGGGNNAENGFIQRGALGDLFLECWLTEKGSKRTRKGWAWSRYARNRSSHAVGGGLPDVKIPQNPLDGGYYKKKQPNNISL